jgi:anti-sigma B factor antagonist
MSPAEPPPLPRWHPPRRSRRAVCGRGRFPLLTTDRTRYGVGAVPSIRIESVTEHALVVSPEGEVDLASAPALREAIEDALSAVASVVVDLTAVSFIDSSIVGVLATASTDVARREAGSQLVVVSPPGSHPRRVLDMVRAATFLRLYDDRPAALASIGW